MQSPIEFAAMMSMTPLIIGARMFGFGANTAESRAENALMLSEKMQAAGESAMAMGLESMREGMKLTHAMALGKTGDFTGAADRIASEGIKPYAKRVRANVRRLGKPKS